MPSTRASIRRDDANEIDEDQTVLTFEKKRKDGTKQLANNKRRRTDKNQTEDDKPEHSASDVELDGQQSHETSSDEDQSDEKSNDGEIDDVITDKVKTDEPKPDENEQVVKGQNTSTKSATQLSNEDAEKGAAKSKSGESSSIIEKGIIYFLTRGRVETDNPENVTELQRTFFVLRPLESGIKLGDGPIPDEKVSRLIAVPKKVLPKSQSDKFMVFVEKARTKMTELKEDFFPGSENNTKTMGVRKTPPVTVIGEGVYAITVTSANSHLAYILTIPSELGEVQKDLGIREKGSFQISLKNPTAKGPRNTQLAQDPEFPKEILDDFRGLRWIPVQKSEHLNYDNAQLLLIGEGQGDFANAFEVDAGSNDNQDDPQKELEKLEDEQEIRIEHLHGDNTIFDDLRMSKSEFPPLKSTW